jgi:hypothetical protein
MGFRMGLAVSWPFGTSRNFKSFQIMVGATIDIQKRLQLGKKYLGYTRRIKARIPETWQELKRRHFKALADWYFTTLAYEKSDLTTDALLFCDWAKLPPAYSVATDMVTNPAIQNAIHGFLKVIKHPAQLLPWLLWYRGPGQNLKHMRYGAYVFLEACIREWTATQNPEYLRGMVALSYAPHWRKFSPFRSKLRTQFLRLVPRSILLKGAFSIMGQRNHIPDLYPELYDGKPGKGNPLKIDQQVLSLCGTELGKYSEVVQTPVHRILEFMQLREQQARKLNPNHGKHNRSVEELSEMAKQDTRRHNAQ